MQENSPPKTQSPSQPEPSPNPNPPSLNLLSDEFAPPVNTSNIFGESYYDRYIFFFKTLALFILFLTLIVLCLNIWIDGRIKTEVGIMNALANVVYNKRVTETRVNNLVRITNFYNSIFSNENTLSDLSYLVTSNLDPSISIVTLKLTQQKALLDFTVLDAVNASLLIDRYLQQRTVKEVTILNAEFNNIENLFHVTLEVSFL